MIYSISQELPEKIQEYLYEGEASTQHSGFIFQIQYSKQKNKEHEEYLVTNDLCLLFASRLVKIILKKPVSLSKPQGLYVGISLIYTDFDLSSLRRSEN